MNHLYHPTFASGLCSVLSLVVVSTASALDRRPVEPGHSPGVLPSVVDRFATAEQAADETVDFQRHLVPLLGRLGCNGRACDGSFQGQGGFQLSLFGYDFDADHEGLFDRIDVESPDESYALLKALGQEDHGGKRRVSADTWEFHVFRRWIEQGGQGVGSEESRDGEASDETLTSGASVLQDLVVEPRELVFREPGESVALRVVAVWDDGTREDVTPLARFRSNDDQVATIDDEGVVTSHEPGGTHVVVMYDNGVEPIAVMRRMPGTVPDAAYADYEHTAVDRAVAQRLRTLNIEPSAKCDDATFLRRASLDIAGTLPTASEVESFLADTSANKRSQKIDELLDSPAYDEWTTIWLADITGNNDAFQNNIVGNRTESARMWHNWLRERVAAELPYDELVEGIILAKSRMPGEDYAAYCERMSVAMRTGSMGEGGLFQYWARSNFRKPEERAIGFAYTFLGLKIECAQCHKHPFDEWTQDDFTNFQNFFTDIRFGANPVAKAEAKKMLDAFELDPKLRGGQLQQELDKLARAGEIPPYKEVYDAQEQRLQQQQAVAKRRKRAFTPRRRSARVLGGDQVSLGEYDDPRQPLMDWIRGDAKHLFAKATVNRIWARYFGRGIVNPTDDLSLANAPSNEALLDLLAEGFIEHDFDLKWVHRTIANSRTYQTSWEPTETNRLDEKHFARALIRRLPAEIAVDAVYSASVGDEQARQMLAEMQNRAVAVPVSSGRSAGKLSYALTIFGKNVREANCDCDRSDEPSLLQTIYLRNDLDVMAALDSPRNGWLKQVADELGEPFRPNAVAAARTQPANYAKQLEALETRIAAARKDKKRARQLAQLKRQRQTLVRRYGALPPHPSNVDAVKEFAANGSGVTDEQLGAVVRQAYLRTVSRPPTAEETAIGIEAIRAPDSVVDGVRDLLWALINTKEFQVNH